MTLKEWEKAFKALGQHLRLRIIVLLAEQELCVCELEEILGITQPAISQHLRVLKEADLVWEEKVSQWVFYHLKKKNWPRSFRAGWPTWMYPWRKRKSLLPTTISCSSSWKTPRLPAARPGRGISKDGNC